MESKNNNKTVINKTLEKSKKSSAKIENQTSTKEPKITKKNTEIFIEFNNLQFNTSTERLTKKVEDIWTTLERDLKDMKTLEFYVKPDEAVAYYVINAGTDTQENGKIEIN